MSEPSFPLFSDLKLSEPLLRVLQELGYESPSPIQAATIPLLLNNRDVLGQAQTGTGKTASFALPILARIDIKQSTPQALVLAPTKKARQGNHHTNESKPVFDKRKYIYIAYSPLSGARRVMLSTISIREIF